MTPGEQGGPVASMSLSAFMAIQRAVPSHLFKVYLGFNLRPHRKDYEDSCPQYNKQSISTVLNA